MSVFYEKNGQFKERTQNGRRWSSSLVKFVNRILKSFPMETPTENNINDLRSIEKKLEYVKSTIQPWFSKHNTFNNNNVSQDNTPVPREKITKLW